MSDKPKVKPEEIKGALSSMVDALRNSSAAENMELARRVLPEQQLLDAVACLKRYDGDRFHFEMGEQSTKVVEGVVSIAYGTSKAAHSAAELLSMWDFVTNHIKQLFSDKEGMPCCADKEGTVTRMLLRHLVEGTPIVFNYEGKYTYHLPKAVLTTHERILKFHKALVGLYYGYPKPYFEAYLEESKHAAEWAQKENAPDEPMGS